jgi:3-deoxy-manno-octulosonate cytidylyltransferase (CMP-KDO synthetase)
VRPSEILKERREVPPAPDPAPSCVCAIPARYASTRLPGKPLQRLAGKPMIEHVYERAARARGISRVVVLTDDRRIGDVVQAFGGDVELTPASCASGTDRIAWAARGWHDADAVVNVQGDEPLLDPELVTMLAAHLESADDEMATLAAPADAGDAVDAAKVKVVTSLDGHALYFSRSPIPFPRDPGAAPMRRHVGLYGYRRATLLRLAALPPSPLERSEGLEQLRALEHGIRIRVLDCRHAGFGVDTPEDLARADTLLRAEAANAASHTQQPRRAHGST